MDITRFVAVHREALLIGDYNTYRAQLSRQILAARRRLGRATNKREKFAVKPVSAEDIGGNHDFARLVLLTSERAWAHAMHIKTTHTDDASGRGITGSTRSHLISRLSKAAKIARDFVASLDDGASNATEQDKIEARAYLATLAGSEEFEKHSGGHKSDEELQKGWKLCLQHYAEARVIYAALLKKEKNDVYRTILADTVDPTIRYAAYQARLSRTIAISTVAKRYFPKNDKELVAAVEKLDANALQDKPANIVDASIGQALANVTAAEQKLRSYLSSNPSAPSRDQANAYDDVLISSQDAADATKRAIDELEKERVEESDARMQDLRVTSLSVNYDLVSWRVGRYRILIGKDDGLSFGAQIQKKPRHTRKDGKEHPNKQEPRGRQLARLRERVVLYDAIIQSIHSVKELRGAMRDESFVAELDGKASYFRALKCLNISYSHSLLDNHLNALALLKRARDLVANFASSGDAQHSNALPTLDVHAAESARLRNHVNSLASRMHAIVEMQTLEANSALAVKKNMASAEPVVERLNDYPSPGTQVDLNNLVRYPPKIEPVPVKPLFLDVAFNYIDYPGRKAQALVAEQAPAANNVAEGPTQQPQKKGWFSFGR
ncbi:hypothetical protein CERZMDRAFT_50428 [Cercospora zeae-maydis SCOH1-5]|uniref:Signal recognition particle subunit SRP68 n=1 Tax=Cercospora zeae-maydis SCOH1-5 TaxID=717836 RepID=A0A6A6F3L9_9PEZI|nr:hypothetical protein CERZMDRAFT_50428 [Cercospora zeae-maydis SCOH1-5]